ncbi:PhzF family phenazine biosynthesis protein [Rhodococcus sovatensis]|uniref:PhzF family phenazine biosynthesis protein n=1 Tax=Rhodococcus sovatensis TaxID=1805840 RepID=A0ABZ2PWQ8_9NOCA
MTIEVSVVRVFTDESGEHGNALGIVRAEDVAESDRQSLATKLGFSETVFFSSDGSARASTTIYTPAVELPFAGHPTVGLSWWLREHRTAVDTLTVPAADLRVRYEADTTWIRAKAAWAPSFTPHPMDSVADVLATDPASFTDGHHYVWAWNDEDAGSIRSRMFAPTMGITEDEATGSAAVWITAELGRGLHIEQGRGSVLRTTLTPEWIELGGTAAEEATIYI